MSDKKTVENAVLEVLRGAAAGSSPSEVAGKLSNSGVTRDDVRDAVARLADRGAVTIGSDLKMRVPTESGSK